MCQLCESDKEKRQSAREYELHKANQLNRIAKYYTELGTGYKKPHNSKDLDALKPVVISIIRELVEEWI